MVKGETRMTCMKQEFCIHEEYCQRHIGQNFDSCILFSRNTKPMTNEEWFCGLSTEEKAKWLDKVAENCCQICDEENREICRSHIAWGCKFENAKKWEKWLKQPHIKE